MTVIVLTAIVLSIELILASCALLAQIPIPVDMAYVHSIMPSYQRTFQPQRNLFLYGLWLAFGTALFLVLRWIMLLSQKRRIADLKLFLLIHFLLVFLMGHAGFEILTMGNPVWAWPVFWVAFGISVLITIFWPEFLMAVSFLRKFYISLRLKPWVPVLLGCVFIFLVIYIPDLQASVAMMYMGDYFHDLDVDLLGGVYAVSHGLLPDIDVITAYGFGIHGDRC